MIALSVLMGATQAVMMSVVVPSSAMRILVKIFMINTHKIKKVKNEYQNIYSLNILMDKFNMNFGVLLQIVTFSNYFITYRQIKKTIRQIVFFI